jgi:hypothetical protein
MAAHLRTELALDALGMAGAADGRQRAQKSLSSMGCGSLLWPKLLADMWLGATSLPRTPSRLSMAMGAGLQIGKPLERAPAGSLAASPGRAPGEGRGLPHPIQENPKKGRAEDPPCRRSCLKLFAIDYLPRNETEAGPPSGHPPGPLLKPSSRLASLRIVFLSQDWSAVLTSLMICAVLSG